MTHMLSSPSQIGVFGMKIKALEIEGVARVQNNLSLEFNEGMNIICGINGTCKTTILECIAHSFSVGQTLLKKNAAVESGLYKITTDVAGEKTYCIHDFSPTKSEYYVSGHDEGNCQVLYFKTSRNFQYTPLNAIPKDNEHNRIEYGTINQTGISFDDFKGWFVHRYLFSHIPDSLVDEQKSNLETAQRCFNVLDENISFSGVKADSHDIMVTTPQGEVYFEYLSAGYKSCLYILLGIIKEIEFRFKEPMKAVKDFDGVILIDEVDLHLHPIWQTTIVKSLKEIFSQAQIIVTTHSPHIIQSAEPNEVIPLVIDENGDIVVNKIEVNEYGYQGWTVEEILEDVMGMESTRSELYAKTLSAFDNAITEEDDCAVIDNYTILQKMLHPRSHLRKVLDIQIAGVKKDSD